MSAREDFDSVEDYAMYLAGIIARSIQEFNYLLSGNLDVANIKAKSITADRMSVKQLSAIAADLGTITAGTVIGALIKTAIDGQRVELSSTENLLKAINEAGNYVGIMPNVSGSPAIQFFSTLAKLLIFMTGNDVVFNTVGTTNMQLSATSGNLELYCGTGKFVKTNSWSQFYSTNDGQSLQSVLNGIYARLSALESAP
ncbi:hypothetical protein [Gorillibacterium sp. sgz5001074]|uniref:hypothetical protein n=1 Tax=Gorillibacterium sp. sgz5001074 TaxID=3446695 RepID=UPI003F673396